MLLLWAMPSMAQSSRLDSLQHVQQKINQQSQQLHLQYDSLYKIIAQCKTDAERLVQYEVLNKFHLFRYDIPNQDHNTLSLNQYKAVTVHP